MGKDKSSFLWGHSLFLSSELVQKLPSHGLKHGSQHRPPEYQRGLVPRETVTECRHMTVAQPPESYMKILNPLINEGNRETSNEIF